MRSLAPLVASVTASGIRRIFELTVELDNVVSREVEEPDLPIAEQVLPAGAQRWIDDVTNYNPSIGMAALPAAIVEKLARGNGLPVDTEQLWVVVGATEALHQAMGLLWDADGEILVPDPGHTSLTMSARMFGAVPLAYSLRPEYGFAAGIEGLDRLVTGRSRVHIVKSTSNARDAVLEEQ